MPPRGKRCYKTFAMRTGAKIPARNARILADLARSFCPAFVRVFLSFDHLVGFVICPRTFAVFSLSMCVRFVDLARFGRCKLLSASTRAHLADFFSPLACEFFVNRFHLGRFVILGGRFRPGRAEKGGRVAPGLPPGVVPIRRG